MRNMIAGLFMVVALVPVLPVAAESILQQMEQTLFPDNYRMRMSMVTREPGGREREMELTVQYRRGVGSYMEIESPPRSRGTRFLQREETLWMFIPRSNSRSAIRLSSRDSFQGSVFSNRDVGESMYTQDYRAEILATEFFNHPELGRVEVYQVEATPQRDVAAYGRILFTVAVEGSIPLRMQYFARSGVQTKEMHLTDIRTMAGRQRPLRMEMVSLEEEGKVSIVRILELEEDSGMPDRIFTQGHLTR